jgi:hypothetical protein
MLSTKPDKKPFLFPEEYDLDYKEYRRKKNLKDWKNTQGNVW